MPGRSLLSRAAVLAGAAAAAGAFAGVVAARAVDAPALAVVVAAAPIAAVLGAAAGALFAAPIARQLGAITRAANRIAAGELRERVSEAPAGTAALTASFNHMAARSEALVTQVERDRARIEAVLNASVDPMVAVGRDSTVQLLNPAAASLFQVSGDGARGRPLIEVARDFELDLLVRGAATDRERQDRAVIAFGPQRVPLRASAVPIESGGEWAVLLVLTDLSEVQRFDAMRRDFLSNVSHEIRTPLASMRALVEIIEDGDFDDEEQRTIFLNHISRQVGRLSSLVTELLDLSRIESGAMLLHPEMVDVLALARETATLLDRQAAERGVRFDIPEGTPEAVEADRHALTRVLTNLLDNAVKYSPDGGTVTVGASRRNGLVTVAVKDEGRGISPEALPRVFERFYKEDAARASPGAGLGLAIVKHLARAHGGSVEVESRPGEGAVFRVHLPERFIGPRGP